MSTEVQKETKGRYSWAITVLEIIVIVAYFAIGFGGIAHAFKHMDFAGMFESVRTAFIFLNVALAAITVLCFVPIFRSKGNIAWAIWNAIWIAFNIYSIL